MILDGKKLKEKLLKDLKEKVEKMDKKPSIAVILVGENPASRLYVNNKKKTAESLGILSEVFEYGEDVAEGELIDKVKQLNKDDNVNAILIQLPLPQHIDKQKIIDTIDPKKDVDGLTTYNMGKLFSGGEPFAYPCTPKGIMLLLEEYNIELDGKHAVVVGRSNLVGKPVAQLLLRRNATVTTCHSHTKNLTEIIKTADIVVSAVGENIIRGKMLKPDCVVVDVGIFKDSNGKLSGDVAFDECSRVAKYISPVPGGVGPMTITSLMLNTVELSR